MNYPLVSVVLPTYNRGKYIEKAIESVWRQTYKNIELIIVNDGSFDNTQELISKLSQENPKIIVLTNEKSSGMVNALNRGIKVARGKYIARLDDDDVWLDDKKIEKQVDFLENNKEYVLVGGGVIKVNDQGKEIVRYILPEKDKDIRKTILSNNVFIHSSVMFLKGTFKKTEGYREDFGFFADWELWLHMGKYGKLYNIPSFFVCYLDNEDKKIGNSHDIQIRRKLKENIKMKKNYKNYYTGYQRAILFSFLSYIYSFIPFRKPISKIVFRIKKKFYGFS